MRCGPAALEEVLPIWIFIIGILSVGHTAFAEKSLHKQIGKIRITDDVTKTLISEVEIMNDKDKAKFAEKIVKAMLSDKFFNLNVYEEFCNAYDVDEWNKAEDCRNYGMILRAVGSPGDNVVKVLLNLLNENGEGDISWKKYFAALAITGVNPGVEQAVDIVGSVAAEGNECASNQALDALEKIGAHAVPALPNLAKILTTEIDEFTKIVAPHKEKFTSSTKLKVWQIIANMNLNDVSPVVAHLDVITLLHFLEPKSSLSRPFLCYESSDFDSDVSLESKTLFVKLFSKMGNNAILALTEKIDRGTIGKAGVYILDNLENHEIVKRWRNQQELNAAQLRKDRPKREQDLITAVRKVILLDEEYKRRKYQLNYMTPLANVSDEAAKLKDWGEKTMDPALRNLASLVRSFCADYGVRALYDLSIKGGFRDKVNDVLEISRIR